MKRNERMKRGISELEIEGKKEGKKGRKKRGRGGYSLAFYHSQNSQKEE
jgi:hypothetical protein